MCNQLHKDFEPIPEKGRGWKIFSNDRDQWLQWGKPYEEADDGWIPWVTPETGDGFCFFPDFEIAMIVKQLGCLDSMRIHQIEYEGGLGTFKTTRIIGPYGGDGTPIALCKRFRILEEVEST
jgi:hypothetical protein